MCVMGKGLWLDPVSALDCLPASAGREVAAAAGPLGLADGVPPFPSCSRTDGPSGPWYLSSRLTEAERRLWRLLGKWVVGSVRYRCFGPTRLNHFGLA